MRKNLDLFVAIIIVALNIVWVQVPGRSVIISVVLVLPLVFFLSGYALTQLLFRKKSLRDGSDQTPARLEAVKHGSDSLNTLKLGHPIGGADEIILSLGLSMAIDILVGFGLNILPIGLQALSWTFSLGILTVFFALIALFRRRRDVVIAAKVLRPRITLPDVLFLLLAAFIVGNSLWLAVVRTSQTQSSFTQFWMLPANQTSKTCAVSLGIQSFEASPVTYTVSMTVNNTSVASNTSSILLAPQQKWVQLLPVTPEGQNDLRIEAQLYKIAQPDTIYRDVHLTFHVAMVYQNGRAQPQCTL
jgi:uncharacterized membrane protein